MPALKHGVGQTPGTGPSAWGLPPGNGSLGLLTWGVPAKIIGVPPISYKYCKILKNNFIMITHEYNEEVYSQLTVTTATLLMLIHFQDFGLIEKTNKVNFFTLSTSNLFPWPQVGSTASCPVISSNRTTPKLYMSDFIVSFPVVTYSGAQ